MNGFAFLGLLERNSWISPAYVILDRDGNLQSVSTSAKDGVQYQEVDGYALPGIPNAHSHAFQYAMAGIVENRINTKTQDTFWSWRTKMYEIALTISPEQLENIAAQLYAEMLRHGVTQVTEFHYLHNDQSGAAYSNRAELGWRLVRAAKTAGIRITLVPILYQQGGFSQAPLPEQRRFIIKDLTSFEELINQSAKACDDYQFARLGVGIHSLRAIASEAFADSLNSFDHSLPFHIHISEQIKEVEQAMKHTGKRPVEWLLENAALNRNCNLVHATHMTSAETRAIALTGARVILCPSTEANLGDGFFNFKEYQESNGSWCIGSDSHIGLNPFEDLRLLDYGQRLKHNVRKTFYEKDNQDTMHSVFQEVILSGKRAGGEDNNVFFETGDPFDALIVDGQHPLLQVTSTDKLLDTIVYTSDPSMYLGTLVSGDWKVRNQKHIQHHFISNSFIKAMKTLNFR